MAWRGALGILVYPRLDRSAPASSLGGVMSTRIGPPTARTTVAEDGAPPYGFQGCHGVLFAEDIWVRVVPTARVTSFHGIPACMGAFYGEDEDDSSFKDARSSVALDEDQSSAAPQTRPPTPSFAPLVTSSLFIARRSPTSLIRTCTSTATSSHLGLELSASHTSHHCTIYTTLQDSLCLDRRAVDIAHPHCHSIMYHFFSFPPLAMLGPSSVDRAVQIPVLPCSNSLLSSNDRRSAVAYVL
ncbi:hypothetical protein C8Q76DRAFT_44435 [Earliella scabrosa]|nr:hypothetical protein C8Q76DRAFT_44435 [Earliella scabrosa]